MIASAHFICKCCNTLWKVLPKTSADMVINGKLKTIYFVPLEKVCQK